MNLYLAEAEKEYSDAVGGNITLVGLEVHEDGETGGFLAPSGGYYEFAYCKDSDDLVAVKDEDVTEDFNDFAQGLLFAKGFDVENIPHQDSLDFLLGYESVRGDAKCGRGWEPGGNGCVRAKKSKRLKQGAGKRSAALAAGALGATALAAGGAAGLAMSSKKSRGELKEAGQEVKGAAKQTGKGAKLAGKELKGAAGKTGKAAKLAGKSVITGSKELTAKGKDLVSKGASKAKDKLQQLEGKLNGKKSQTKAKQSKSKKPNVSDIKKAVEDQVGKLTGNKEQEQETPTSTAVEQNTTKREKPRGFDVAKKPKKKKTPPASK